MERLNLLKPIEKMNRFEVEIYWIGRYKRALDREFETYRDNEREVFRLRILNERLVSVCALEIHLRLQYILNQNLA